MAVVDEPESAEQAQPESTQPEIHLSSRVARQTITANPYVRRFRKRADILAVQMARPFVVETEHGAIGGDAGDWLTMNDPATDPGSDAWPLSDERRIATYVPAGSDDRRSWPTPPPVPPALQLGPDPLTTDRSNALNRIALALEALVAGDQRRLELLLQSTELQMEHNQRAAGDSEIYRETGRTLLDSIGAARADQAAEDLTAAGQRGAAGSERRF